MFLIKPPVELSAEQAMLLLLSETPMRCEYARVHASRSRLFWNPLSKQNKLQFIPLEIKENT